MMNKNEVKKDLYKSKEVAEFSRYVAGNMYYQVKVGFDVYEFPIPTVETIKLGDDREFVVDYKTGDVALSSDLGTTTFYKDMKGSDLNRWIGKAIDNDEFNIVEVVVAPI